MEKYTGGDLMCNGYLLSGEAGEYVAVDAPEGFAEWVLNTLPQGAKLAHLLLTHQHFDHIQDAAALQAATGCCVHACAPFSAGLTLRQLASAWGLPQPADFEVHDVLGENDCELELAGLKWRAQYVPGHAAYGMVYYLPALSALFAGDVLFSGSIGRTDMPGGSQSLLVGGIRRKLMTLPPDTDVYPGHGPATSVQEEALNNPFVQG